MTTRPLRILSFGAGAIGTYIGGSLALAGHTVVFIERPELAGQLHQSGLRLQMGGSEQILPAPQIVASLESALALMEFDAALFALKSFDTLPALEGIRPYASQLPPVVCLQNGVDNETALESILGPQKVIAATVLSAIARPAPGVIVLERLRGVGLSANHPLSRRLYAAFEQAGLRPRLYPRPLDMKWSKLLTNLLSNATSAILNLSPSQVFAHPGLFKLEMLQLREALSVMRAASIGVTDLPGTPVRLLALGARLPFALAQPLMQRAVGGGRGGKMPSFHIDLYSGRGKSEVDYLNGAVVRLGEKTGISTPINRLLRDTLLALTEGKIPLSEYDHQPEKLLGRL